MGKALAKAQRFEVPSTFSPPVRQVHQGEESANEEHEYGNADGDAVNNLGLLETHNSAGWAQSLGISGDFHLLRRVEFGLKRRSIGVTRGGLPLHGMQDDFFRLRG